MRRPTSRQRRLVILLLALITFSVAYYAGHTQKRHEQLPGIDGVLINPPIELAPIDLYNHEGKAFSLADMQGHWNLLMLDPGPGSSDSIALTRLIQVHNRLASNPGRQQKIDFLYLPREKADEEAISFTSIADNFQALHGNEEQLNRAFEVLGGYAEDEQYSLYLIGPKAKLHALFTQHSNAATIAEDIDNLLTAMQ